MERPALSSARIDVTTARIRMEMKVHTGHKSCASFEPREVSGVYMG